MAKKSSLLLCSPLCTSQLLEIGYIAGHSNQGSIDWVVGSEELFHVAHHNPMAGDLGQDKTPNCLMARFIGKAFTVMIAGGVSHVVTVSWWICQLHQKHHCALFPSLWSPSKELVWTSLGHSTGLHPFVLVAYAVFHMQCYGDTIPCYFLSWDSEGNIDWSGHYFHVTHPLWTV